MQSMSTKPFAGRGEGNRAVSEVRTIKRSGALPPSAGNALLVRGTEQMPRSPNSTRLYGFRPNLPHSRRSLNISVPSWTGIVVSIKRGERSQLAVNYHIFRCGILKMAWIYR